MIKVLSISHCETPRKNKKLTPHENENQTRTNIPCGFGNHSSSEGPSIITRITIGALATISGDVKSTI
ncbi:hypothetical protein Hanom_Chr05g00390541 [Helianthus anomalus]